MATYCLANFVNDPSPNDRLMFIYNCSGTLVVSIDPYASTFFKKGVYVYVVTDGKMNYDNVFDFDSETTADLAVARLNDVKKIFIDRTNQTLNGCVSLVPITLFNSHTANTQLHLIQNERDALTAANNPSSTNAILTQNDISAFISGNTQIVVDFHNHTATTNAHWVTFNNLLSTAHTHVTEDVFFNKTEPTAIVVGGIVAGTNLSGKSVYEILDLMMYPELFPSLTNPSNSFSMSITGYREVGEIISSISFSSSFNRGSISPTYGTSGYRSGLPNQYNYTGTDLTNVVSTSLTDSQIISNYTILLNSQSWTGGVSYDGGEQPLSSKGNNYGSALSAGSTSNITRTIIGVYPYFATSVSITTQTKQSLTSHGSSVDTSLVAESGSNKQYVEFPLLWGTITILQQYNTLSGLWDTIDLTSFTITDVTNTINGNVIDYKKYTHNGGLIGARKLRWRVS